MTKKIHVAPLLNDFAQMMQIRLLKYVIFDCEILRKNLNREQDLYELKKIKR